VFLNVANKVSGLFFDKLNTSRDIEHSRLKPLLRYIASPVIVPAPRPSVGAALAANAQSGSGEQNPAQVHVPNEAKQAHPSAANTI
jgi:hypothetical protein